MSVQRRGGVGLNAPARAFGGDAYAGGRRALLPAPGHSAADRSVSLWLRGGRVVVHSFGGGDWREVLDDLRKRGWIDTDNCLLEGGAPCATAAAAAVDATRAQRIATARRLWDASGPISIRSPAALYLTRRGVGWAVEGRPGLRALAAAPAAVYRDRGPRRPALIAGVRMAEGDLTAVEITYLDASGRRSAVARPPRKIVGVLPAGCAVRLAPVGTRMVVGEGVPTTLSAMRRFDRPGWALLSTSNLRRWRPPSGVRHVLIAADRGPDGERSAARLRAALVGAGVDADVALPPENVGDWNDLDREE